MVLLIWCFYGPHHLEMHRVSAVVEYTQFKRFSKVVQDRQSKGVREKQMKIDAMIEKEWKTGEKITGCSFKMLNNSHHIFVRFCLFA